MSQLNKLQWRYDTLSKLVNSSIDPLQPLPGEDVAVQMLQDKEAEIRRLTAAVESKHGLAAMLQYTAQPKTKRSGSRRKQGKAAGAPAEASGEANADVEDITLEGLVDSVCPDADGDSDSDGSEERDGRDGDFNDDDDADDDIEGYSGGSGDHQADIAYLSKQMDIKRELDQLAAVLKQKQDLCKLTEDGVKTYDEVKRKSEEEVKRNEDEIMKLTSEVRLSPHLARA